MSLLDGLKSMSRPRPRRDRSFWLDDNRVVSCYECDAPFTLLNRKHHCRACGRIFCSNCTTSCVLEDGQPPERVCNFCKRLHVESTQVSRPDSRSKRLERTYLVSTQPRRKMPQSATTLASTGSSIQVPAVASRASYETSLVRTGLNSSTKGIRDPALTWDVPPPLRQPISQDQSNMGHNAQASSESKGSRSGRSIRQDAASQPATQPSDQQQAFAQVSQQHLAAVVEQLLIAEGCADVPIWQPILTKLATEAAASVQPSALAAFGVADPRFFIKVKRLTDVGAPGNSKVVNGLVFRKNVVHKSMKSHILQPRVMLLGSMLEYHRTSGKLSSFDTLLEQEHAHLRNTVERIAEYKPSVLLVEKSVARYAQELLLKKGISLVLNVKRSSLLRLARCTESQVASSVEDINNHCIAFCKEFKVEVLQSAKARASAANSKSANTANSDHGHIVTPHQSPSLRRSTGSTGSADSSGSVKQPSSGPRTLMFFKDCPRPLGCTVLLYGADADQLQLLKRVTKFAVFVAYAGRLENAFLADEMASAQAILQMMQWSDPNRATRNEPVSEELLGPTDVSLLTQATAAMSAAGTAEASKHEPIVSVSPHVPRCICREVVMHSPSPQSTHETVASAPLISPTQHSPKHASPGKEQPHTQQQAHASGLSRAHRQLFASQSAPSRQPQQQSTAQSSQHLAQSPKQAAEAPDLNQPDQTRCRGLQLYSRQRLFFCKLCRNPSRGLMCEPSSMQKIEYYQNGDVPLASFVAASAPQKCPHPACGDGVFSHLRTFLHNRGRITLSINQTAPGKELPGADKGQVWFWARPLHVSPAEMQAVRRVPLSSEALCLSFGHFLELSFGAHQLKIDDRSLHGDFVRYLGMGSTVLCFHYEAISPNTVQIPARLVHTQRAPEHTWLHREVDDLTKEAKAAFAAVQAALQKQLEAGSLAPDLASIGDVPTASSMPDLMTAAKDEQAAFEGMLKDVAGLLTPDSDTWLEHAMPSNPLHSGGSLNAESAEETVPTYVTMLWELGRLRRSLAVLVMTWAATLHDPVVYARPISHSHSVPNSLHSMQESGCNRLLSTESLPELHKVPTSSSMVISEHNANPHEDACAHDAADISNANNSSADNDSTSTIDSCDSPKAQQPDPIMVPNEESAQQQDTNGDASLEPADSKPARTVSLPAVSKGIVAQTIRQLERRETERTTPTRLNAAAAARRYLASALQQRARTLQWLDSSKLSSDETVLRSGEPISQLAYMEVHLHVTDTGSVICQLVRRTQHARALQALGLQKDSASLGSDADADESSVRTPIKLIQTDASEDASSDPQAGQATPWRQSLKSSLQQPDSEAIVMIASRSKSEAQAVHQRVRADTEGAACETTGAAGSVARIAADTSAAAGHTNSAAGDTNGAAGAVANAHDGRTEAMSLSQRNKPELLETSVSAVGSVQMPAAAASSLGWPAEVPSRSSAPISDSCLQAAASLEAEALQSQPMSQEQLPNLQTQSSAALDQHMPKSMLGYVPPNRVSSDGSALKSHFDDWAHVLDSEAETSLSRRGSGKLHGLEPDMLRSTVDGILKRQPVPSKLQPNPASPRVTGTMSTAPSLSQKQMNQIMSAGSSSYKQTGLQPNAIPLSHGKVDLRSRALLASGAQDIVVPVYDEEPTSIVAYALASRLYQTFLIESQERIKAKPPASKASQSKPASAREAGLRAAITAPLSANVALDTGSSKHLQTTDDLKPKSSHSSFSALGGGSDKGGASLQQGVESSSSSFRGPHNSPGADSRDGDKAAMSSYMPALLCEDRLDFQHVFEDAVPGMPSARATFQVTAYYAPQFDALRELIVAGRQPVFLACLSRCKKWLSQGGKSNVYFAKTRDERYVVKQLTRSEKQSFLDFAPAYFRYLANTYSKDQDTCLAKVLGLYQVSKKTTGGVSGSSGKPSVMDLLVMENVLYATNTSRIYDLKGSERSRWSQEDPTRSGSVLMDDNLRENNLTQPILVDQAAHAHLEAVLWRDTAFLAGLGVMDYSLLVGLDSQQHRLVIGIIDFIRQYTWDKQLETWVKSSVMLGGARKEPTVISPKQYCRRFRVAISSYFVFVPSAEQAMPSLDPDALM